MIWVDTWDDELRSRVATYIRSSLGDEPGPKLETTLGHDPPCTINETLGIPTDGSDPTPMFWRPDGRRSHGRGYLKPMVKIARILAESTDPILVELADHVL